MWKWENAFYILHVETTIMELFPYYDNTQSPLYFIFCLKDYKLYKFIWFLTIMNIMWESYALRARGNKCESMLWIWQWSNKNVFKHKTRLHVNNKIKNIVNLCFYHVDCDFLWSSFWHEFFCFKMHIFFSFIMVCSHLKCYTTHGIRLIMWKETIERINEPNK
jgi:hypothetical protein